MPQQIMHEKKNTFIMTIISFNINYINNFICVTHENGLVILYIFNDVTR